MNSEARVLTSTAVFTVCCSPLIHSPLPLLPRPDLPLVRYRCTKKYRAPTLHSPSRTLIEHPKQSHTARMVLQRPSLSLRHSQIPGEYNGASQNAVPTDSTTDELRGRSAASPLVGSTSSSGTLSTSAGANSTRASGGRLLHVGCSTQHLSSSWSRLGSSRCS